MGEASALGVVNVVQADVRAKMMNGEVHTPPYPYDPLKWREDKWILG